MSLFDQLGQRPAQQQPGPQQMQQEIGQIKAHPSDYLKSRGYNVPEQMTDARQITQYLLQTGQIGTPRLQQVMSMLGRR